MSKFIIEGGKRLSGEITPQGAKNEALQILCAVLLTSETITIENIPLIRDVLKLIELLEVLGVEVKRLDEKRYSFRANEVNLDYLRSDEYYRKSTELRGSVMLVGPMLGRFGKAFIPKPGGDKIGRRRLDTHF
ncbi:UDP-N-acetylglucosamine 1-carboxyvinyltransferase, partial [Bacteroidota bacterium]